MNWVAIREETDEIVGPFDSVDQANTFALRCGSGTGDRRGDGWRLEILVPPAEMLGSQLEAQAKECVRIYRSKVHAIKALREWAWTNLGYTPTLHECTEVFRPVWPGGWDAK